VPPDDAGLLYTSPSDDIAGSSSSAMAMGKLCLIVGELVLLMDQAAEMRENREREREMMMKNA
jgi:hypothetical protein